MQVAEAFVALRPDTKGFQADAEKQLGSPLKNIAAGAASAFAAVKVKDLFSGFIDEAREAEKVSRLTEAALKSTGGAANITAPEIDALAGRLSDLAAVDDDLIQKGANVLLTFTGVRNEAGKGNDVFNQGVESALNLSSALGTDLQGSIMLVGKALNDPITGMTALRRAGVQLTEAQQEQVKAFVAAGDTLSAQKIILKELETQFGGAAAAAADPAQRLSVEWGNLQEQLGTQLLPVLNAVVTGVGEGIDMFSNLPAPVQQSVLAFVALAAVSGPLLTVGGNLRTIGSAIVGIPSAARTAATALQTMALSAGPIVLVATAIAAIGAAAVATSESLDSKLNRILDETANLAGDELVEKFQKGGSSLDVFDAIAERNVGTAIRLRDELKRQGETTGDLDRIIDGHVEKQRNAEASTKAATAAVTGEQDALADLAPVVEETTDALQDLLDVTLSIFDADLNYEQQVNRTEDALAEYHATVAEVMKTRGKDTEAIEAQERATLDAAEAILGQAKAASEGARKQKELAGETLSAEDAARIQREELLRVASTLAPGSPLRSRLEGFANDLGQVVPRAALGAGEALNTLVWKMAATGDQAGKSGADIARKFADGIIAGFRNSEGQVVASADSLARNIDSAARRALRIQSPSLVGMEIGEFFAAGIALGVENGTGDVEAAIENMLDRMLGGLSSIGSRRDAQDQLDEAREAVALIEEEQRSLPRRIRASEQTVRRRKEEAAANLESREAADALREAEQHLAELRDQARTVDERLTDARDDLVDAELRAIEAEQRLRETGEALLVLGPGMADMFRDVAAAAGLSADEIERLLGMLDETARASQGGIAGSSITGVVHTGPDLSGRSPGDPRYGEDPTADVRQAVENIAKFVGEEWSPGKIDRIVQQIEQGDRTIDSVVADVARRINGPAAAPSAKSSTVIHQNLTIVSRDKVSAKDEFRRMALLLPATRTA